HAPCELPQRAFNRMLRSSLAGLQYSTYRTQDGSGGQMAYVMLNIDLDNNGTTDDILFFEPVYQRPASNPALPDQGDPQTGVWLNWNATVGGWWSLNSGAGLTP